MNKVLSIIMGGGQGLRLYPLTRERSKPAVPLAGKYRLVDIPISNCLNSGLMQIYLLTQFNSASLHRHVTQSYKFDSFSRGFVEILAAQQTFSDTSWYEGTADAVRKNLTHFRNRAFEHALVLSGDQLYQMDFEEIINDHRRLGADVTIATLPVEREKATDLGIMKVSADGRIVRFEEKPKDPEVLDSLRMDPDIRSNLKMEASGADYLASMGIYVFTRQVLFDLLNNDLTDFGKHIIPNAIQGQLVYSYIYQGYWEDIGTIRSFFDANLDLASEHPRFDFFDLNAPIYSRPRFLPASKFNGASIQHAMISDGCRLNQCSISNSTIGIRSMIGPGSQIDHSVVMGNDFFEAEAKNDSPHETTASPMGVGRNTRIEYAIIDKNARIGSNCVISPKNKPENVDHAIYYIRDGIVIIPKNGVVPDNTVI